MNLNKYIYQLWPSKHRFYLKGLLITGPKSDLPMKISLYIMLIFAFGFYVYFVLPVMITNNILLLIAFLVIFITTITFMFLSSFRDSGIIPIRPFLQLQQKKIQSQASYNYSTLLQNIHYQRLTYLLYETSDPEQIFCCSCHIYRPSSASHCSQCDSCVIGLDHHCPWLGNCIAQNNYWPFLLFLGSIIGLMVVFGSNIMVYVAVKIDNEEQKNKDKQQWSMYVIVCCIIVGSLLLVLIGFFIFHLVLLCKGKTTRQFIKSNKKIKQQKKSSKVTQKSLKNPLMIQDDIQQQQNHNSIKNQINQSNKDSSKTKKLKIDQKFLDNYVNNLYRETSLFYNQLFKSRSSIHLINFRQKLSIQDSNFISQGLKQLQQKKKKMNKQGTRYQYNKQIISQ